MRKKPAVLFDLGDVLVHLHFERGLSRFVALAGGAVKLGPDTAGIFIGEKALAWARGDLGKEAFFSWITQQLGAPQVALADCAAAWCECFDPWPEMEALAAEVIDAGHPAYLLSNTDPLHFAVIEKQMPILKRFDGLYLSYQARAVKPELEFFTGALEKYALAPADCLFVDDRPPHIDAARAVGIRSMVHTGDVAAVREFLVKGGVGLKADQPAPNVPW